MTVKKQIYTQSGKLLLDPHILRLVPLLGSSLRFWLFAGIIPAVGLLWGGRSFYFQLLELPLKLLDFFVSLIVIFETHSE